MKRVVSVIFAVVVTLVLCTGVMARTIDPKGDSLAIAKVREKMAEIRKLKY